MHYYSFNIGDYCRQTTYLTPMQNLCYRLMLDRYYLKEEPFADDPLLIANKLGLPERVEDVKSILDDFFELIDGNWHNKTADNNITQYRSKLQQSKDAINKRWNKGKSKEDTNTDVIQTNQDDTNTDVIATNNQEPIEKNNSKQRTKIPYQDIQALYNLECKKLPQSRILSDKRKKLIKAIWLLDEKHQDLEFWRWYFNKVQQIKFLSGDNNRGWQANFEWLLLTNNFVKVVEGSYR